MPISYPLSKALPTQRLLTKTYKQTAASVVGSVIGGVASSFFIVAPSLAQITAAPATLLAQNYPLLSAGSTGSPVSQLQATLKLLGFYAGEVNGSYTAATEDAVAQFQSAAGIAADGVAGPSTWAKLLPAPEEVASIPASQIPQPPVAAQTPEPQDVPPGPPILRPGIEGPAVAQLQRELTALGYYEGAIDGGYGELTQAAVRAFQADRGLAVDAIVGPSTWDALTQALAG